MLIVYYGNQVDEKLLSLAHSYSLNICFLQGAHLKKLIKLYRLFHSQKESINFSYLATTNMINALVGKIAGVRFRIGGIRNSKIPVVKMIVQRILHNYFLTGTVFNNHSGLQELVSKGFSEKKSYVIHNCIDVMEPAKKSTDAKKLITILSVGRFVESKDFNTAIEAIQLLQDLITKDNGTPFKFIIVGYGPLEERLRLIIEEKKLQKIVEMHINPKNIKEIFKRADIYISTSLYEGLSNSIMEAMEFSLPIIATDIGDNKYLIIEGETGFLVPVKDTAKIADKLEALIKSDDLRYQMGVAGYEHLKKNFSEEVFQIKYFQLIEQIRNE